MSPKILYLLALIMTAWWTLDQDAAKREPDGVKTDPAATERAERLIRQARAAAGGEEAQRKVSSLAVSIEMRRFVHYVSVLSPTRIEERDKTLKGGIRIELMFPNKFRKRVSTTTLLGTHYSYTEIVNGGRAWREPPLMPATSSRRSHAVDVSDFEQSLAYQARNARHGIVYYALAWLNREVQGNPLRMSSEGWMKTGEGKADVIVLEGGDDFHSWFLLDQKTHLPFGYIATYWATHSYPVIVETTGLTENYLRALRDKARQERAKQTSPPGQVVVEQRFADYRRVDGILLPHRMTILIDGRVVEQQTVTRFEINRRFDQKTFQPGPNAVPPSKR